jgi:bifunctional DNase/RNase
MTESPTIHAKVNSKREINEQSLAKRVKKVQLVQQNVDRSTYYTTLIVRFQS